MSFTFTMGSVGAEQAVEEPKLEVGFVEEEEERGGVVVLLKEAKDEMRSDMEHADVKVTPIILPEVEVVAVESRDDIVKKEENVGESYGDVSVGTNDNEDQEPTVKDDLKDIKITDCQVSLKRIHLQGDEQNSPDLISKSMNKSKRRTGGKRSSKNRTTGGRRNGKNKTGGKRTGENKTEGKRTEVNRKRGKKTGGNCCPKCGKTFGQRGNLITHMLIHTGEKPFRCPVCPGHGCRQFNNLKIHMWRHHPGTPVPLKINNYKRRTYAITTVTPVPAHVPAPVPEPENPFSKFKLRDCHVKLSRWDVDDEKPMSSSLILQKFNSMANGRQDLLLQVKAEGRQCIVKMDTNLLAHFLQPLYPPPPASSSSMQIAFPNQGDQFSCRPTVPLSTSKREVNNARRKVKRGSMGKRYKYTRNFKCTKCNMAFTHHSSFLLHTLRSHPNIPNKSQFKEYTRKDLPIEIKRKGRGADNSAGDGMFGCTVCGRKFKRLDIWKKHMQIHSGDKKSLQCPICHKAFSPTYMSAHMRVHTGEKPFACHICCRRFSQSSTVTLHMRSHNGETYKCSKCPQRYSSPHGLNNHLRAKHSGEMNCYSCKVCGESFSDEVSRTKHSASH